MLYSVWLQLCVGAGYKKINKLIERYGGAENVYKASNNDLKFSGLFSENMLSRLKQKDLDAARKVLNDCHDGGITVIVMGDKNYPPLLSEIPSPPIVLYAKGNIELLNNNPCICVVGPREVSAFGKKAAFSLAARLAAGGMTIVSGGALGSDTAAHKGALAVGGNTICVLAAGIGDTYLKDNEQLREEISQKGLLISEYPPGTGSGKYVFRARNRLMSGLSLGTVVIEAGEKSGAMITANHAIEQNRDVFVIPGNPTEPQYKGSNSLLRDGAKALLDANDVFLEYLPLYPHKINPVKAYEHKINGYSEPSAKAEKVKKAPQKRETEKIIKKNLAENLSNNAKIVYNYLDKQVFFPDEINAPELTSAQVISSITELEIRGYIQVLPGGRYTLK